MDNHNKNPLLVSSCKEAKSGIFMLGDAAFMQGEMMYGEIETFRLAHVVQ